MSLPHIHTEDEIVNTVKERCALHVTQLSASIIDIILEEKRALQKHIKSVEADLDAYKTSNEHLKGKFDLLQQDAQTKIEELDHHVKQLQGMERRVYCLVDGDGAVFDPRLLADGVTGGEKAARMLSEHIRQHLKDDHIDLWTYVFVNVTGLTQTLNRAGHQDAATKFHDFVTGFNAADNRFLIVDVGRGKESADARIRVYLEDHIKSPQTKAVIFAGCHDNGYSSVLKSLVNGGFRDKITLLPGYNDMAVGIRNLDLKSFTIPELFLPHKLEVPQATPVNGLNGASCNASSSPPARPPGLSGSPVWNSILSTVPASPASKTIPISYKAAIKSEYAGNPRPADECSSSGESDDFTPVRRNTTGSQAKRLDYNKPFHQHLPPPCNRFYLIGDCKVPTCRFGHDYLMKDDDLQRLRDDVKKNPCESVNNGKACSYGDSCIYGHKCPAGRNCFWKAQGKCKFVGKDMHAA